MRKELLDILACPTCKGDLDVQVKEESGEEIVRGTLLCKAGKVSYPIEDSIPNLLPQDIHKQR